MIHPVDTLLALVLLSVLISFASSRLPTLIKAVAFQGVVVSIVPFFMGHDLTVGGVVFTLATMLIRGIGIPLCIYLAIKKVALTISPAVRTWLAKKGHDPTYGARPLARVIQNEVKDKLSDEILFGELQNGGLVSLDMTGDELTFNYG